MVSSGTVNGDLNSIKSKLSKYGSEIDGLSSNWKGQSYDNLNSKADAFLSEFEGALSEGMSAFATACDLYVEYKQTKSALSSLDSSLESNQSQIASYQSKLSSLKSQIESSLATASSKKLGATSTSSDVSSNVSGDTSTAIVDTSNQNPDLIYSTATSGYVFPFAKGVKSPVTSHVGKRSAPTAGASTNHQGTDIGVPMGTPIHAIYSGKVVTSREFGGYGYCVRIQQDDGNLTYYGHCSQLLVKEGTRVNAGDVIAKVGSTGVSTGPHLHLEIRANDYDKNKHLLDSEEIFKGVWPS